MPRLFTAPAGVPGETTLGASPEDWQAITDELWGSSPGVSRPRRKILATLALAPKEKMIPVSFTNAEAERIRSIFDRLNDQQSGMPE